MFLLQYSNIHSLLSFELLHRYGYTVEWTLSMISLTSRVQVAFANIPECLTFF